MVIAVPFLRARVTDDGDFLKLRDIAYTHDGWTLDFDKVDIKIWSKATQDAAIKMVKVFTKFSKVKSADLYNTLMDPVYRKEWDPHMVTGFDIGHLNSNNVISYYAVSCPPPLRSRDFILQSSWLDKGTEHYVLNHSVCHKDFPPKRNYIRAISYFTGYVIKSVPPQGCEMYFVTQTDPQGIIPAWIVNKCTQIFAPRFIKQLEKAASAYSAWKTKNNPDNRPWVHPEQMATHKISTDDCIPSEEEQKSQFFKYITDKAVKITQPPIFCAPPTPQTSTQPPTAQNSDTNLEQSPVQHEQACSSKVLVTEGNKNPQELPQRGLVRAHHPKERKRKKNRKAFWLKFTKMCLGKEKEST